MTAVDPAAVPFWESGEAVTRFAARDPDHRLMGLLDEFSQPTDARVLDLGCAAGRNTVVLAERGFDFVALDSSSAMVAHTLTRVAQLLGEEEASQRVLRGTMYDLSAFPDGHFDMVITLGVLHQAGTRGEWETAVSEVSRVLRVGGRLLHASWSPESRPEGEPLRPVPGEPNVYLGFRSGRHHLLSADAHDAALASHGLVPVTPTETVRVETGSGERVTINGLYRRLAG